MSFFPRAGRAFFSRTGLRLCFLVFAFLCLNGCAGRLNKASERYYAGHPQEALKLLEKGDHLGKRNQLLFLMERGVVLHQLGQYQESIRQLLNAAELIDGFDKISISEQAGSLVTSEWLTRYKGEYSERLWVHSYLMMDYLLVGQYDDALVEAKRALEQLEQHPQALKKAYFTRALIALCFSNLDEYNDAFLTYRRLAGDLPSPAPVAADLVRLAERLGMTDEADKYRPYLPADSSAGSAELVLFVANGKIPQKRPGNVVFPPSIRFSFPYYSSRSTVLPHLGILPRRWRSRLLISTDMAKVARDALEARKVQIIARETARVAAKEAISQSVGNDHGNAAEVVVRVGLFLLEEPDVRSWKTLPGRLTLLRIPLPAGRHTLELEVSSPGGGHQLIDLPDIQLRAGQRVFRSVRF